MMAKTHVAQGVAVWLGGCVASTLAGWPALPEVVLLGTAAIAGAALLPDADHRSGTLSNIARPVSSFLCDKVADLSSWAQRVTATKYDRYHDDGHRGLTHTGVAAIVAGIVATLFVWLVPYGAAILVGVMVAFASQAVLPAPRARFAERWRRRARLRGSGWGVRMARKLGRVSRRAKRAALVWSVGGVAGFGVAATGTGGWWLGLVVAAGWLTHLAGDACSVQGVPFWWPLIKIRGQRWRMVGLWVPLRIHTGGPAEVAHLVAALILAGAGFGWLVFAA